MIQIYIEIIHPYECMSNIKQLDNNDKIKETSIEFVEPNPWSKIITDIDGKKYFFVVLNFFNERKYMDWKDVIPELDYDIDTKELVIESKDEPRALAILNLLISNMKGDISIKDIFKNDLMNKSIIKARKHKMVSQKLLQLIKENNKEDVYIPSIESFKYEKPIEVIVEDFNYDKPIKENIEDINYDKSTEKNEYESMFENNLNKTIAKPYEGKAYASPFSY